jgi:ribonuclease E
MGKVIIVKEPYLQDAPKTESKAKEEPQQVAQPIVEELPVVESAPENSEVVENSTVEVEVVETPNVDAPVAAQSKPAKQQVSLQAEKVAVKAPQQFKGHATAPMAKASGSNEVKEITIVAAPLKTERYQAKGAGSQAATNKASAGMTKPNY